MLQDRNREIVTQLEELKKEKLETGMTDEDFNKQASEIKNVKKPNGAKPGFVIYTTNQTAYVTPKNME